MSLQWSDEQISRANRFTLHVVLVWVALVTLQAVLAPTGPIGVVFGGAQRGRATWLLAHSLFSQVDELVKTRIEEASD
ncbi:hypothetical protein LQ368_00020 [Halobacterium noricense]|uniref:hypothetical protein n=1 Tax=Halobacterium noricense TaxID=223182 RepID=UPI001F29F0A6|nr:hypothetical protein [Halobacterium noricense]MCG1001841.1 hypothetical protein [Halobacterium noricense]